MVAPDWLRAQVPAAWFDRYGPRLDTYLGVLFELATLQVHFVDQEFIQPQVNDNRKTIGRIGQHTVCVRTRLPLGEGSFTDLGTTTEEFTTRWRAYVKKTLG